MTIAFDPSGGTQSFDNEVLRRTFRLGARAGAAAALVFGLFYAVIGPEAFVLPHLVAATALLLISAWRRSDPTPLLYSVVAIAMLLFGWQLVLLAGVENAVTLWFVVPCMAALLAGQRRLALFSLAMSVVEIGGVVALARSGWLQPRVTLPQGDLVMAMSAVSVMVLCGAFADLAHRARQALLGALDQRHLELSRALADAREARHAALEAVRSKERFFANLTHEIRTPLAGLAGAAELLQHTEPSDRQRTLVDALGTSSRHLVELVNAMLEHARLAAGHVMVERRPFELRALARSIDQLHRAAALAKGLDFELQLDDRLPQWISSDEIKLRQIIGNLVSNAIKFTERGGLRIEFGSDAAALGGAGVRLQVRVTDSGPGIAPGDLEAIFEPFVQGDSSISRAHGGTGLGLAIARGLAERLDGTLAVASHPGAGSTFTLELPVVAAEPVSPSEARTDAPRDPAAAPQPLSVLLVEDNEVNRLVVGAMLGQLATEVQTAAGGEQALALLEARTFDVIFMDMQMPGLDGLAATREIRRREALRSRPRVPVIALTGNTAEDYGDAATEAGMDGYLTKPVTLAQLRRALAVAPGRSPG